MYQRHTNLKVLHEKILNLLSDEMDINILKKFQHQNVPKIDYANLTFEHIFIYGRLFMLGGNINKIENLHITFFKLVKRLCDEHDYLLSLHNEKIIEYFTK